MESGVPGAPGVAVLRPVEVEVGQGPNSVTLLHHLMEENLAMAMVVKLQYVTILNVKVGLRLIKFEIFIKLNDLFRNMSWTVWPGVLLY